MTKEQAAWSVLLMLQFQCFSPGSKISQTCNRSDMYVCVSGGKKCSFFGKFDVLCFLETPVSRFALLPYHWRISNNEIIKLSHSTKILDQGYIPHYIYKSMLPYSSFYSSWATLILWRNMKVFGWESNLSFVSSPSNNHTSLLRI